MHDYGYSEHDETIKSLILLEELLKSVVPTSAKPVGKSKNKYKKALDHIRESIHLLANRNNSYKELECNPLLPVIQQLGKMHNNMLELQAKIDSLELDLIGYNSASNRITPL